MSTTLELPLVSGRRLALPPQEPTNGGPHALVNAALIASGPCWLWGFSGINNNAATRYIQVFDSYTPTPASGAVPEVVLAVATVTTFSADYTFVGRWFARGIVIASSTTLATFTAGSADMWVDAQYTYVTFGDVQR